MTHCAFAGRRALGSLPDPLVRVDSLGALSAQINAQNTRIIIAKTVEGDRPQREEDDPSEMSASQAGPGNSNAGKDPPARGNAGSSEEAILGEASLDSRKGSAEQEDSRGHRRSRVDVGHPGHSRAVGRPSEIDNDPAGRPAGSYGAGMDIGKPDATSGEECHSEAASSSTAGQQQAGKRRRSRLGALISRFRRRKPLQAAAHAIDTATSTEAAPEAQSVDPRSSPQPVQHSAGPSDELLSTARPAVPGQEHDLSSQPDETRAPRTAAGSHGVSKEAAEPEDSSSDDMAQSAAWADSSAEEATEPEDSSSDDMAQSAAWADFSAEEESDGNWVVYFDWAKMNRSMMDSMHKLVSTMQEAFVVQVILLDAPSPCASLANDFALLSGCAWRWTRYMMQWLHNIVSSLTKGLVAQVSVTNAPVAVVHQRLRPASATMCPAEVYPHCKLTQKVP